jgi:NDP-sugar pyrophosphorylase family protein
VPGLQGRADLRGDADHLPGLQEGLSHPRRHPGHARERGGTLDPERLTAVILAGGQGTRLRPLTLDRPKPIVPLLNRPFLAYQLDLLRRHGVTDVSLSCSYLVEAVRLAMQDGAAWGVRLGYAVEPEPLGTAGGVRNAVAPGPGLVLALNGDVLTDVDLSAMLAFHRARGAAVTIYLTRVPDPTPFGLVETDADGRIRAFVEKPEPARLRADTINAGAYLIDRALLARIPTDRPVSIEREFFPCLVSEGVPCYGWVAPAYWLDIGSPAKYRQAQLDLLAGRVSRPEAGGEPLVAADLDLDAGAAVVPPVAIGPGSRLLAGARVGPASVLGRRSVVGPRARIAGAVCWEEVDLGPDATLADCVVGARVRIGRGASVGPGVVVPSGAAVPDGARLTA